MQPWLALCFVWRDVGGGVGVGRSMGYGNRHRNRNSWYVVRELLVECGCSEDEVEGVGTFDRTRC